MRVDEDKKNEASGLITGVIFSKYYALDGFIYVEGFITFQKSLTQDQVIKTARLEETDQQ